MGSKNFGDAFGQHQHTILNSCPAGFLIKQLQRFLHRLVGEPESPVVHRHHPPGIQIQKGTGCICWAGVYITKLRRVVSANRQKRELRAKPHSDFTEAGEVRSIAGVIDRMFSVAQNVSSIAAVRVAKNTRSPMARWYVRNCDTTMSVAVPPIQLNHVAKT